MISSPQRRGRGVGPGGQTAEIQIQAPGRRGDDDRRQPGGRQRQHRGHRRRATERYGFRPGLPSGGPEHGAGHAGGVLLEERNIPHEPVAGRAGNHPRQRVRR